MSCGAVVDASVAQACGQSNRPPSPHCAAVLDAIQRSAMAVLLSRERKQEWGRHRSRYFARWWKEMTSKKRVRRVELAFIDALVSDLHDAAPSDRHRRAVTKDAHLVGLGIEHAGRVLSLDDEARGLFADLAVPLPPLGKVHWANPARGDEGLVAWLERDAPEEPARQLASFRR